LARAFRFCGSALKEYGNGECITCGRTALRVNTSRCGSPILWYSALFWLALIALVCSVGVAWFPNLVSPNAGFLWSTIVRGVKFQNIDRVE
jgi:hypothetical protein